MIPENHISLIAEERIKKITIDLTSKTDVNYFIYARFYDDGSHFCLPTNADWHKFFWEKGYHKKSKLRLQSGALVWNSVNDLSNATYEAKNLFDMDNKFEIVERGIDYYDIFGFSSAAGNNKIVNFYINNIGFLKRFTFYFKEKAKALIKECNQGENRLFIENTDIINVNKCHEMQDLNFMKNRIRRYLINTKNGEVRLSNREIETVTLYMRGLTAADIGDKLGVSDKTAEYYISSAKEKLHCNSKAMLFELADQLGIVKQVSIVDI